MINAFLDFINNEQLFEQKDIILLAVSGGADSVAMAELFHRAKFNFAIAHCNFHLRAEESNEDEVFVHELALKYDVKFYCRQFDTNEYAKENGISIEMAARELRYEWFNELLNKDKYDYLATAHHLDDQAETLFINLLRSTGISGLHGILPKQNKIIRPLLFANKDEILAFLKENNVTYREDSTNITHQYVRNKIRHQVIPALKEINPSFLNNIGHTIENLKDTEKIYKYFVNKKIAKIVSQKDGQILISISKLKKLKPLNAYAFEILSTYNFNASVIYDIIRSLHDIPGKQFLSLTHRLIRDRDFLIITDSEERKEISDLLIHPGISHIDSPLKLDIKVEDYDKTGIIQKEKHIATLDHDKLEFPLLLRKWKEGDYFYPFGMEKKKKLSRFFIDNKFSIADKENAWVLCSGSKIAWIVGHRIDNRFRVRDNTKTIIRFIHY